jgi:hypothetical protein
VTSLAIVYCFIAVIIALNLGAIGVLLLTARHIRKTSERAFWND